MWNNTTFMRGVITCGITLTLLLSIISLGVILIDESQLPPREPDITFEKVELDGQFMLNGENYYEGMTIDRTKQNHIVFLGTVKENIPENQLVILRSDNLNIEILHEGVQIYLLGSESQKMDYVDSTGNMWARFRSPGIESGDPVEIRISNIYDNRTKTVFLMFFDELYTGYEYPLLVKNLSSNILNLLGASMLLCIGLITLVVAVVSCCYKSFSHIILIFGCLSICSGVWLSIDFSVQSYFVPYPIFNNSLDIVSLALTAMFLQLYFMVSVTSRWRYVLGCLSGMFLLVMFFATATQFLGVLDYYRYSNIFFVLIFATVFVMLGAAICELRSQRNRRTGLLFLSTVAVSLSTLADLFCIYFEIIPKVVWFKIGFCVFIVVQFIYIVEYLRGSIEEHVRDKMFKQLSFRDSLTGVKNRDAYKENVEIIDRQIKGRIIPFAVAVFDINNLKTVDDCYGYERGDEMIKSAGKIICEVFAESLVFRLSGDKFVVIMEGEELSNSTELLAKLDVNVSQFNTESTYHGSINLSIAKGIAFFDRNKDSVFTDVFNRAETAMYQNKAATKLTVTVTPTSDL